VRLRSLRLRLALLAAALAGISLAAFGATAWWMIRDSVVARVDTELRARLAREMSRPQASEHWRSWEEGLRNAFRVGGDDQANTGAVAFVIIAHDGTLIHRSESWPAGLRPDSLPQPPMPQESRHPQSSRVPSSVMGAASGRHLASTMSHRARDRTSTKLPRVSLRSESPTAERGASQEWPIATRAPFSA